MNDPPVRANERVLWIHGGTHKTGTKVLQGTLSTHRAGLARAGLCYPVGGYTTLADGTVLPAHFSVMDELSGKPGAHGLTEALAEIDASGCRTACISAEGFHKLYPHRDSLATLRDRVRAAGWMPRFLVYLRSQADYLESLYAQLLLRGITASFPEFVALAIAGGSIDWPPASGERPTYAIAYLPMLDALTAVFGRRSVVARAYRNGVPAGWLADDFFATIGIDAPPEVRAQPLTRNERAHTGVVLARLAANRNQSDPAATTGPRAVSDAIREAPFRPLRLADALRISTRFAADDLGIARRYGARVAPVSAHRWRELLATETGFDSVSRAARRAVERAD
jgi:hypothetical protein